MPPGPFTPRHFGPPAAPGRLPCVVVHGFTGAPWDVWPVARALGDAGFPTACPLLAGHGGGWQGVAAATADDWRRDVLQAARALHQACGQPVLLAGLSMGGVLSLDLAIRGLVPVAGIASLAAPLTLGAAPRAAASLAVAARQRWGLQLRWPKWGGPDIQRRRPLPGAATMPLTAIGELLGLIDEVRGRLAEIMVPLLIVQSRHDHTSPATSPLALARGTSSRSVRLVVLDRGYHVLPRDLCAERVVAEVLAFAGEVLSSSRSPSGSPHPGGT